MIDKTIFITPYIYIVPTVASLLRKQSIYHLKRKRYANTS